MIQEPPVILFQNRPKLTQEKRAELTDMLFQKKKERDDKNVNHILLNEIISIQSCNKENMEGLQNVDKMENPVEPEMLVEESKDDISEEDSDKSFEDGVEEIVNNIRLNNLTGDSINRSNIILNISSSERKEEFGVQPESQERGYFCDSKLVRHSEWKRGCGLGYFENYQLIVKEARKRETDLEEQAQEHQKKLMDVYFKEREKVNKPVSIESELPLVTHLMQRLGVVFRENKEPDNSNLEAEDEWNSENEQSSGIRPRRRRLREMYGNSARNEMEETRQERRPLVRRVMTRSRLRELRNRQAIQAETIPTPNLDESDEEIEINRRRSRVRRTYEMENIDERNGSSEEEEAPKDNSIAANVRERRRRHLSESRLNINSSREETENPEMSVSSREMTLVGNNNLNKSLVTEPERNSFIPGRVVTSFHEEPRRKKKMCYHCQEEIFESKKKRKCTDCEKVFHLNDCLEEGTIFLNSDVMCFECYFKWKNVDKQIAECLQVNKFKRTDVNRESFGYEQSFEYDLEKQKIHFEITESDEVYLIPGMFTNFIQNFAPILPGNSFNKNLDLLLRIKEDLKLSVLSISFALPQMRFKYESEKFLQMDQLMLFQVVTARIIDVNVNELRSKYGLLPIPDTGNIPNSKTFFFSKHSYLIYNKLNFL